MASIKRAYDNGATAELKRPKTALTDHRSLPHPGYSGAPIERHYSVPRAPYTPPPRTEWGPTGYSDVSPYAEYGSVHRGPYASHAYPQQHYAYSSAGTILGRSHSIADPFSQRQYSTESRPLSRRPSSPAETPNSTAPVYFNGQFDYSTGSLRRTSMIEDEDPGTPPPDIHGGGYVFNFAGAPDAEPSTSQDPNAPHQCSRYLPCLVCMNRR